MQTRWQKAWDRTTVAHNLHSKQPTIPRTRYKSTQQRKAKTRMIRIKSSHNRLKTHLIKCKLADSPSCQCGFETQNEGHLLLHCPLGSIQRAVLIDKVENIYIRHNTPPQERRIDFSTLNWPNHTKTETKAEITNAVGNFLMSAGSDL